MMAHERSMSKRSEGGGVAERVDPLAQPAGEPDGDEQDGAAVAEAHGPAHEVHLMHDHEGGRHEVHSVHPDGHTHMSSHHQSAAEAHDHAKKLAGAGGESSMEHGEPDGDEAEYE
jgi:hypothetical protein